MDPLKVPEPRFRRPLSWNQAMVLILAAFLFAMFLQTISSGATIEGYSVLGTPVPEGHGFAGTTILLFVVFSFFGLFILIISRKLDYRNNP